MTSIKENCDIIIIGIGVGGGTLANRLTPTGRKILVLKEVTFYRERKLSGIQRKFIKNIITILMKNGIIRIVRHFNPRQIIGLVVILKFTVRL
jgi:flavin-dependent dehydrogenase